MVTIEFIPGGPLMKANSVEMMLLNLQMFLDPMDELLWEYTSYMPGDTPTLRGCLLYCGQSELSPDIVYLLPPEWSAGFSSDRYAYITTGSLEGRAPHIRNVKQCFPDVLNRSLLNT